MALRTPRSATGRAIYLSFLQRRQRADVLFLVTETTEKITVGHNFDELRLIRFGGEAGLIAMTFLAFAPCSAAPVSGGGVDPAPADQRVGFFSMPHRGFYVMGICTLFYATIFLPKVPLVRRFAVTGMGSLLIGVTLFGGDIVTAARDRARLPELHRRQAA